MASAKGPSGARCETPCSPHPIASSTRSSGRWLDVVVFASKSREPVVEAGHSQAIARRRVTSLDASSRQHCCRSLGGHVQAQVRRRPARDRQEAPLAWDSEQHLRPDQADQLVVGEQLRPSATPPPLSQRRKERAGGAIDCDQEGVEVGATHCGLLVDIALATPTFDTLALCPYSPVTARAVNYRSSV